jgi:hypothetical protein
VLDPGIPYFDIVSIIKEIHLKGGCCLDGEYEFPNYENL